ncbi:hypothetical protein PoB_002920900 [Plakobranchus ocellatus]|uniref:Uncharacterized protein n=1 Tax=Plakobranchus ocellatus TaxID=259542 RepID=A0AAV4A4V1_9GAST|nr:hypothetical protein PoB_002920900 [Plakobranchus ocellatus]
MRSRTEEDSGSASARDISEVFHSLNVLESGKMPKNDAHEVFHDKSAVRPFDNRVKDVRGVLKRQAESGHVAGRDLVEMGDNEDIRELEDRPTGDFGENPVSNNAIVAEVGPKKNLENAEMGAFSCNSSTKVPKKKIKSNEDSLVWQRNQHML